jgi:hypothetical protein
VPKATVATFGRPFGDIVTAHGGVPRLVAQIVAVLAERGFESSRLPFPFDVGCLLVNLFL